MKQYKLTFNKPPISVNHAYGSRGTIRFLSKAGKEYKKYTSDILVKSNIPKIEHDEIIIEIIYYFPDKRRRDVGNYEKCLLDSLTGIIYNDDCQIRKLIMTKYIDKENPRTEMIIFDPM